MQISIKKYYFALMVMLLALLTVGLTACSNDDEPKGTDIVGTWQYNHPDDEEYDDYDLYYQFTKDGKFHQVWKDHAEYYYGRPSVIVYHGTYTVSGKKLIVTYDSFPDDGYAEPSGCEYSVQGDKLMLLGGEYPTFIRVEDSVIEPYLNIVPHPC